MPNTDDIRTQMAATNEIFNSEVFRDRNFDALDRVYTTGARILPPGGPLIEGLPGIKEFWKGLVLAINATAAVLTSIDVMPAGDDIVEIGKAVLTLQPEGQPEPSELEVKYVVYWREEEGSWKWHVDIWNQNS